MIDGRRFCRKIKLCEMVADGIQPVIIFLRKHFCGGDGFQRSKTVSHGKLVKHVFFKAVHKTSVGNG